MTKNLNELLIDIQSHLTVPKKHHNKFGGFYYRNFDDIIEALKPTLKTNKILLTINDEMILIGERYYMKSTATISLSEQSLSSVGWARETATKSKFDEAQLTGSASSYARKYALNGLFLLDDSKDIDSGENKPTPTKEEPTPKDIVEKLAFLRKNITHLSEDEQRQIKKANEDQDWAKIRLMEKTIINNIDKEN